MAIPKNSPEFKALKKEFSNMKKFIRDTDKELKRLKANEKKLQKKIAKI